MVWNRRATKRRGGRVNPISDWVWSSAPTHDALASRETFLAAWGIAEHRERSRTSGPNSAHPQTRRAYPLRSYLFCVGCGRRMFGKTRRGHAYYACQPAAGKTPAAHPGSIWIRESDLLAGLSEFFANRVLGAGRRDLLAAGLADADATAATQRRNRIAALRRDLADIDTRRVRLIRSLERTDDPDGELAREVYQRLAQLRADHDTATAELRDLEDAPAPTPTPGTARRAPGPAPRPHPTARGPCPRHLRGVPARDPLRPGQPHRALQGHARRRHPARRARRRGYRKGPAPRVRSHLFCAPGEVLAE
jgi:hypothetical protein